MDRIFQLPDTPEHPGFGLHFARYKDWLYVSYAPVVLHDQSLLQVQHTHADAMTIGIQIGSGGRIKAVDCETQLSGKLDGVGLLAELLSAGVHQSGDIAQWCCVRGGIQSHLDSECGPMRAGTLTLTFEPNELLILREALQDYIADRARTGMVTSEAAWLQRRFAQAYGAQLDEDAAGDATSPQTEPVDADEEACP